MAQKSALFWDPKIYLSKNDLYRGNFMRGIDCAHSRTLKTLPWPWFRGKMAFEEKSVFFRISQQLRKKIIFASKTQFFSWIRVREAFSCFGNARNRFLAWKNPLRDIFQHFSCRGQTFSDFEHMWGEGGLKCTDFLKFFLVTKKSKILVFSAIFTSHIYKKYFFTIFSLNCV